MANVYFHQQADMANPYVWYGYVTGYSSSYITLNDYGGHVATYYGSFTFSSSGLSGGTVTGYKQWEYGALSYEVSGASVSAVTLNNYLNAGNGTAVHSYVLSGNDYISGSIYGDFIKGWAGNDLILGNGGDDTIYGGIGNDVINGGAGVDTLFGGAGNDTYVVDNVQDVVIENQGEGTDLVQASVSYTLSANVENLTLTGSSAIDGTGNNLDNVLLGNGAENTLSGGNGNDTLHGGAGADTLIGGYGNDTYLIDNAGDVVTEAADEGTDVVKVGIAIAGGTYILTDNVENATLTNAVSFNLTGNTQNNSITGNTGNNRLDGGTGADTLLGGAGNDTYVVDNVGDKVYETTTTTNTIDATGTDTVESTVTWTLDSFVENLSLTGTDVINGTGNALANTLTGNSGNNILDGKAGADTLIGGVGADTLIGGAGNDAYVVDDVLDVITESSALATEIDSVESSIDWTLGTNLEKLTLTGSSDTDGTGNEKNNTLTGNSGGNRLDGGTGADILLGGAGNDTYVVDNIGDRVYETTTIAATTSDAGGADTVESSISYTLGNFVENLTLTGTAAINGTGNGQANTITGNSGNNIMDGKAGADTLIGGDGNDIYVVDQEAELANLTENFNEGTDTLVVAYANLADQSFDFDFSDLTTFPAFENFENLTVTGTGLFNLIGNDVDNVLIGNASNNELEGNAGNDTLKGGLGNDSLKGGEDADIFRFDTALNKTTNVDTIEDFVHLEDVLQLENGIFTKLTVGALSANHFRQGDSSVAPIKAADANDYILYDDHTGNLYYDADGSGATYSAVQFATLVGQPTINSTDLWVT